MENLKHQVIKEMPYNLTHFLLKEKCYSQFVNNTVDHANKWKIKPCVVISTIKQTNVCMDSFIWHETEENWVFWSNINKKWREKK